MEDEKTQPTIAELKTACLLFPVPCLNYRALRQSGPRCLRYIAAAEFTAAAATQITTDGFGSLQTVWSARKTHQFATFVKKNHKDASFQPWTSTLCSKEQYSAKYQQPCFKAIALHMRQVLIREGHLPE
eukprot:Seg717.4 transcript_id=Seg717.4/GoldUCD/mRNA.D3Y31 product="hypothetical protein" protein_id=Seg717.4/GoldUCD/D3Y31